MPLKKIIIATVCMFSTQAFAQTIIRNDTKSRPYKSVYLKEDRPETNEDVIEDTSCENVEVGDIVRIDITETNRSELTNKNYCVIGNKTLGRVVSANNKARISKNGSVVRDPTIINNAIKVSFDQNTDSCDVEFTCTGIAITRGTIDLNALLTHADSEKHFNPVSEYNEPLLNRPHRAEGYSAD